MRRVSLLACFAACVTSFSAVADPLASGLSPTLTLGLQFGDHAAPRADALRLTALFDVRSPLRADADLKRGALSPEQSVDFSAQSSGMPLFTVFDLGATSKGLDLARVLGHDMLASSDQFNETGDPGSGARHTWIWWTAGVIAVGSIVGLAARHHDDSGSSNPNPNPSPPGGCLVKISPLGLCVPNP